jgi:hypothetical protein
MSGNFRQWEEDMYSQRDAYGRKISDYIDISAINPRRYEMMSNSTRASMTRSWEQAADVVEQYAKAAEKASAATAEVATQQSKLREATLMLA